MANATTALKLSTCLEQQFMRDREHIAIRSYNYSIDIGLARRLRWTRALDLHRGRYFADATPSEETHSAC